jgi:hypothetical protein
MAKRIWAKPKAREGRASERERVSPEARLLAFELKPKLATGAFIITGRMPRLQPGQFGGRAIGAVKIGFAPEFRDDGDANLTQRRKDAEKS